MGPARTSGEPPPQPIAQTAAAGLTAAHQTSHHNHLHDAHNHTPTHWHPTKRQQVEEEEEEDEDLAISVEPLAPPTNDHHQSSPKAKDIQLSDFVGEHGAYQLSLTLILFMRYVFLGLMANSGPLLTPDVTFYCHLPIAEVLAIMPNISTLSAREQELEIREEFKRICQLDLHLYANQSNLAAFNSSRAFKIPAPSPIQAPPNFQLPTPIVSKSSSSSSAAAINQALDQRQQQQQHETASKTRIRECSEFTYELAQDQGRTMTSEFDLVCDREWLRSLFQSLLSAAIVIAHVFWGTFSDKYGRYQAQRWCLLVSLFAGLLSIFAVDFWTFTLARALCSLGDLGLVVSMTTTVVELVGTRYRGMSVALVNFGYALGVTLLPYIVAYFEDFRLVVALTVLCHLVTMPLILTTNESVRWLMTNRKFERAKRELWRIARCNGNYAMFCKRFLASANENFSIKTTAANEVDRQTEQKLKFDELFELLVQQVESQNLCDPVIQSFGEAEQTDVDEAIRELNEIAFKKQQQQQHNEFNHGNEASKTMLADNGGATIGLNLDGDNGSFKDDPATNSSETPTNDQPQRRQAWRQSSPISEMVAANDQFDNQQQQRQQETIDQQQNVSKLRPTVSCIELFKESPDLKDESSTRGDDLIASRRLTLPPGALAGYCNESGDGSGGGRVENGITNPNYNCDLDYHQFRRRLAHHHPEHQHRHRPDCMTSCNMVAHQLSFVGRVSRLFKDKQLMIAVFTIVWTTFNSELQYTSFIIINLEVGEDLYLNYMLGGCMEALAAISASLLLSYAPRRQSLITFWLLISLSCFGLSIAHIDSTWAVWLLALAKFSQSCLSSIASVAAYESFPTFLRQSGSGLVFTLGMLGSVFAPLIFAEFDDHAGMDRVLMTFSFSSLTAALLIYLFLNETRDSELQ